MAFKLSPRRLESTGDFLRPAERLAWGELEEPDLSAAIKELPPLNLELLDSLAQHAQAQTHQNPKLGWAIARVADESAVIQQGDLLLQGKAAWYLGRAANSFQRPDFAAEALRRARAAFQALNEEGWLAACDWQQHVLAWAQPDLRQSAADVQSALEFYSTTTSPQADYRHESRLTLAYIQTLLGGFDEALENLAKCEDAFKEQQDYLNQVRCCIIRGNVFRRQSKFDEAKSELEGCMALAEAIPAPVELAFSQTLLGYVFSKRQRHPGTRQDAETAFLEASGRFEALDLPFWRAYCRSGLSVLYIEGGRLSEAADELAYCREVYREFEVNGPQANVFVDSGWLETYRANYKQGLKYLAQAEILSQQVGNPYLLGISRMHLGEIYLVMGRYQQALRYLEQAAENFQTLKSIGRHAESGLRLARCWTYLGRPDQALDALKQVEENAKRSEQGNIFPYLYIRQAEALFAEGKLAETAEALTEAAVRAEQYGDKTGAALAQRLLGETLCNLDQLAEAAEKLEAAETAFDEIGRVIEQAACQNAWGQYYLKMGNAGLARMAWQRATEMGRDLAPDIIWQAQTGLASLAEADQEMGEALIHYRLAVQSLVRLRQDMWQPALAGFFLRRPLSTFNQAVRLAVSADSGKDVLDFIEAGKAQVTANLFQRPFGGSSGVSSPELADLVADIRWRQERIRASSGIESGLPPADLRWMRWELQAMVRRHDLLRGRIERNNQSVSHELLPEGTEFDLAQFQKAADETFGDNWLALDYYLTKDEVTIAIITGRSFDYISAVYPGRVRLALAGMGVNQTRIEWSEADLQALGKWLLPEVVLERLAPETVLLVAPHRQLHHLPWPALSAGDGPLISRAAPVVVPSLQSLAVLMARPQRGPALDKGLLLAVSDFKGRHSPLPQTVDEVASLLRLYPESEALVNEAAAWAELLKLADGKGLDSYSFLHIASHAFADTVSGRLSGLALQDRDVWLDELWECAPLPPLVTLSACSGSMSRLFDGDEQVGLETTCLAAGARHVVASLWPVQEAAAADLMTTFYRFLTMGNGVAQALAMAQRTAVQNGKDAAHWAGFRCTGLPA